MRIDESFDTSQWQGWPLDVYPRAFPIMTLCSCIRAIGVPERVNYFQCLFLDLCNDTDLVSKMETLSFRKLVPGKVVLRNEKWEEEMGWTLP